MLSLVFLRPRSNYCLVSPQVLYGLPRRYCLCLFTFALRKWLFNYISSVSICFKIFTGVNWLFQFVWNSLRGSKCLIYPTLDNNFFFWRYCIQNIIINNLKYLKFIVKKVWSNFFVDIPYSNFILFKMDGLR